MSRLLALFAAAALAQDGSFENRFEPMTISVQQTPNTSGAGMGSGSVDAPPTAGATYVAPGSVSQRSVTTTTKQPGENDKKKEGGEPSMPQVPGGGGGEQGGEQKGGGGGGGCKSCSGALDSSKKAVEADLAAANPQDGQTQKLIADARSTVQNANAAKTDLDKATLDQLKQARDSLKSAADQIERQNTQNKTAIDKLQQNQTSRDKVVQSADAGSLAKAPSCTGNSGASAVSDSGTGAVDSAKRSAQKGQSLESAAAGTIRSALPAVRAIGMVVAPMTTAAATSLSNLGGGLSVSDAVGNLTRLKAAADDYLEKAQSASQAAKSAVKATQTAQDSSLKTANHIKDAVGKDKETTQTVKQQCEAIEKAKEAWNKANALQEPEKSWGKEAAVSAATTAKESMTSAQKTMASEIKTLQSEQRTAQSDLDSSRSAIDTLSEKLGV